MEPKAVSSIRPGHQKRVPIQNVMTGEKMYKLSTFTDQLEAKPRVPKLSWQSDECIIPELLCLEFNLEVSGTN